MQHVAGYERQRRHATLIVTTLDITANLTDQAVDLFDRLVGAMFRKAEGRYARAFQADARAINEKVRLYARVGARSSPPTMTSRTPMARSLLSSRGSGSAPRSRKPRRWPVRRSSIRSSSSANVMPASAVGPPLS